MFKDKANNFAFIDSQNLNLGVRGLGWKYSILLRRAVGPIGYMTFFNDLRGLLEYKNSAGEGGVAGGST